MDTGSAIKATPRGVSLTLVIAPRSGRNEIVGCDGNAIKIRLKAPPVEGKANDALLRFLADRLDVPLAALHIAAGATGRHKVVTVEGVGVDEVAQRLGGAARS